MKANKTIWFLVCFIIMGSFATASYWDYLTIGQGDRRYCMWFGDCTLNNLTIIDSIINATFVNAIIWVNSTQILDPIWVNKTGDIMTGDLIAPSFNGSWNGSVNYQLALQNSSNITCTGDTCFFNGTFPASNTSGEIFAVVDNGTFLYSEQNDDLNGNVTLNGYFKSSSGTTIHYNPSGVLMVGG